MIAYNAGMALTPEFLKLARERNGKIPQLVETGEYYCPAKPIQKNFVRLLSLVFFSGVDIDNQSIDNLRQAALLPASVKLIIVSEHVSDADGTAKRRVLEEVELKSLADKIIYPAGLKMRERRSTRYLMGAENAVYIPTPMDYQNIAVGLSESVVPEERRLLQDLEQNYKRLSFSSGRMLERLRRSGSVLAFYPEATRARGSLLGHAKEGVDTYFKDKICVLALSVTGAEKVFPPMQRFKAGRAKIRARAGRPIFVSDLKDMAANVSWPDRTPFTVADVVMAQIAVLNPSRVRLEDMLVYKSIVAFRG